MCTICTVMENACHKSNPRSKYIEIKHSCAQFAPGCKFAPPRELEQINTIHGAKNTPGVQNCTRGANLHPGVNCAHERVLRGYALHGLVYMIAAFT